MSIPNEEYTSALHYLCKRNNIRVGISVRKKKLYNVWCKLPFRLAATNLANGQYLVVRIYDYDVPDAAKRMLHILHKEYGLSL